MNRIEVTPETRSFKIGYTDENNVTVVAFDIADFQQEFGTGDVEMVIQPKESDIIYPVPMIVNGNWAEWTVLREQIPENGGRCQISYISLPDREKKSKVYSFTVSLSLGPANGEADPSLPWIEVVLNAAAQAKQAAADSAASAEEAKDWAEKAHAVVGNKQNWATVRLDKVVEITNLESLRTYFYNLRKSESRDYQVEVSPGNNQNFIDALGGLPDGVTPTDKFFLYFTLPYSEAGGFVIDVSLEGRTNGKWYTRKMWGTIDANWRDSGWTSMSAAATQEYVNQQDAATLETAKNYANAGDTETLNSARQYATQQAADALADAKAYASQQDTEVLGQAKAFATSQDAAVLGDAKNYADAQDATTLAAAKQYTDEHSGEGTVQSVNGVLPDAGGNISLDAKDIPNSAVVHVEGETLVFEAATDVSAALADMATVIGGA